MNDEKNRAFFCKEKPDTFVKYGKYEVRLRDKVLIEGGEIAKATVKWYGYGNYVNPYLWKANKSDTEYQESWRDPRTKKDQKEEKKQDISINVKKNRGRKR